MEFERIADIKRVEFITNTLKEHLPAQGEVLDIGCGNGIISRAIGQMGFHVTGIDVSEKTIAFARASNNLPNVSFEVVAAGELQPGPKKYDAIICSEVLEHLQAPSQLLKTIFQLLKEKGVLVVTVPNGRGPRELLVTRPIQKLQKSNGITWRLMSKIKSALGYKGVTVQSNADDLSHIQFFTARTLKTLAANAGFKVIKILPTNFIEQVFPFSFVYKRSKRLQKFDCSLADKLPLGLTSGFMSIWIKA